MFNLKYVEFYITHVCNLNCTNCNRFNNYAFSEHQHWAEYQKVYVEWANRINPQKISILGGEPMLNPTFIDWVEGILRLWPHTVVSVVTNGTQLLKWPDLYNIMLKSDGKLYLEVTNHNMEEYDQLCDTITNKFLKGPVVRQYDPDMFLTDWWKSSWEIIRSDEWPLTCSDSNTFNSLPEYIKNEIMYSRQIGNQIFIDSNGVKIELVTAVSFTPSAVIYSQNAPNLKLHNSNPEIALKNCISKFCHHFIKGKLYKCGVAGILPDFIKQFDVSMSEEDRNLIDSYVPAEVNWDDNKLSNFLDNLINGKVIPQCKFCPEDMTEMLFKAGKKKIKIVKHEK